MSIIKVDEGTVSTLKGSADLAKISASSLNGLLDSLRNDANNDIDKKLSDYKANHTQPDSTNYPNDSAYNLALKTWQSDIDGAESSATKLKSDVESQHGKAVAAVTKLVNKLGNVSTALQAVLTAVTDFNGNVDMAKAFESVGITVSTEENPNGGDTPVIYYEVDGQKYTLSELLNAFYTYTGMSMSTVVQGAILADQMGLTDDEYAGEKGDAVRQAMLDQVNALTGFAAKARLYGLATQADQEQMANAVGIKLPAYTTVENALDLIGDDETKNKYKGMLGTALNGIGGLSTTAASVFGGAMGAFGLAAFLNKNHDPSTIEPPPADPGDEDSPPENESPSVTPPDTYGGGTEYNGYGGGGGAGGGGGGGGNGNGNGNGGGGSQKSDNTPTPTDPKENDPTDPTETPSETETETPTTTPTNGETPTEPTIPGTVTTPTESNTEPLETPEDASELPTETLPEIPEGLEKDYDDLARQQFEAQGEEAIAEHRAEVIEEANKLFDAEDKAPLKEKLKEYGYEDSDVEVIIQDRDLTVSAMVSGDQRQQLANIAKELAEKDGVTEFDTVYDNTQTATALTDGTTTKLLANMSGDEGVKAAYETLTNAETAYNEANTAAVTAMASVTAAQQKLTEITNSIGTKIKSEPSQWDAATMKSYNDEVTQLHADTVQSIGGNINNWSNDDIKTYQAAESQATTKVAYSRGTDMSTWTSDQKATYEKNLTTLKEKYVKAYGKDTSKWSKEAKENYEKAKTNTYKQMAVEVGKKNLTADDKKQISEMTKKAKDDIIAKNGDMKNWTEAQKKEYDEKVAAIKEKYAEKTSTATGEATWTKEQATEYNKAVQEYNEAVKAAKEAMTKLDEAKTGYTEAKTGLETAKESFYSKLLEENKPTAEPAEVGIVDPAEMQTNSGEAVIGGIEFNEQGASIGTGTMQLDENGVVQPDVPATPAQTESAPANVPPEEIVNDDEAETQDYGIPIVDVGQATSGTISNDDIRI